MQKKFGVVLVPFPFTVISTFAYFLYKRTGLLEDRTLVRFNAFPKSEGSQKLIMGNGLILNLAAKTIGKELESVIPQKDRWILMRFQTYCLNGDNRFGNRILKYITALTLVNVSTPEVVLENMVALFEGWLAEKKDPWKVMCLSIEMPQVLSVNPSLCPPDKKIVTLPIFKEGKIHKKDEDIVDTTRIELNEGRVFELQGLNLGIAVGGPPNSGKSTLTASLVGEVQNIVASLRTRQGWKEFSLDVSCVNLDLATPTIASIEEGTGRNHAALVRQKVPWSVDLALQAARGFEKAKASSNLVFADLPGGKVDAITEITGAHADVGIIITNNWNVLSDWRNYFRGMGIPIVCRARSRLSDEGFSSVITMYDPHRMISGRVVGLDRMKRSWDRFVSWLAEFLLFDLLPSLVSGRREVLQKLLASL